MKAIGVIGPEFEPRLFDIEDPTALHDGVVVEVQASSINEFDRAAARGHYANRANRPEPVLLGRDFVGRVVAVGDDVDYIDIGMSVAGALMPQASVWTGAFADKIVVPAQLLAPVPDGIDLVHAAGVGLAGVTALDAIDALGITGLESVVVHGPVSGVGGFVLQLAKSRGALVSALTPPEEVELAWRLGADVVIPEGGTPTQSVQRVWDLLGGGVDSAIHVAGDPSISARVMHPGGTFTSVARPWAPALRLEPEFVTTVVSPNGHKLTDLLFKIAAHQLLSHVSRVVSFDEIGDALSPHSKNTGRVVVVR